MDHEIHPSLASGLSPAAISALSLPTIDSLYPARTSSKKNVGNEGSIVSPATKDTKKFEIVVKEEVPDAAVVEEHLDRILDSLGVPGQLRVEIKTLSRERKWQIVQMSKITNQKTKSTSALSPTSFITNLLNPKAITSSFFISLRVCVSNEPKSWTSEFLELDGLQLLINFADQIIRKSTKKDAEWKLLYEFLKTLRTFAGEKDALKELLLRGSFLNNLVYSAFGQYSTPIVPTRFSSSAAISTFSGTSTVPPLQNRKATLDLFVFLSAADPPNGWYAVVRALSAMSYLDIHHAVEPEILSGKNKTAYAREPILSTPEPWREGEQVDMFRCWLKEFEMVAKERAKHWNGSLRKANDIFNALADGTYRWQPIVQALPCPIHEKTAVDYMMVNLSLVMTLYRNFPDGGPAERTWLRSQMDGFRLALIYETPESGLSRYD
ncbi:hypothetical protein HDU67_008340 [Dinochytrium kinnereticum]|nr:hypothetical protein HDU67_008340 [Dinochytrium kinnereticum]